MENEFKSCVFKMIFTTPQKMQIKDKRFLNNHSDFCGHILCRFSFVFVTLTITRKVDEGRQR